MSDNLLDLDFDFDSLNADTAPVPEVAVSEETPAEESPAAEADAADEPSASEDLASDGLPEASPTPPKPSKRQRPLWELASILGGVFLVVGLFAWLMMTFVFVEQVEEESTLELPRNRLEAVLMELPVGKIRHEGSIAKRVGAGPQTVFIVEIDASIIVQGTSSELVEVEAMLKSHHHRIEEAIDETVRASSDANLAEPDALVIRSRIRDRINHYFGRPVVKEVLFGHYRAFRTPIKS